MSVLSTATKTLALIAATALLVTGCSVKQEGASNASSTSAEKSSSASASAEVPSLDGKTIGIAAKDVVRDFGRLTYEGVQDRVKELGGKVVATQADAQDDKHIANVENLISQGVDAIVVILGDTVTLEPALKKAHDAGIPLFTIDHASPYSVNNIGSDNWQIGSTLARTLAEDIGGEGEVLVFNGFYDVVPCQIRYDEFKLVLKNYPGIKTIEPELQDVYEGTIEHAKNQVTDVLTRLSEDEIDAVWSCWDLPSIGAAQAIDAAGGPGPDRGSRVQLPVHGCAAALALRHHLGRQRRPLPGWPGGRSAAEHLPRGGLHRQVQRQREARGTGSCRRGVALFCRRRPRVRAGDPPRPRCSRCAALTSASAGWRCSRRSTSTSAPARSSRCSGRTVRASPR
jgi:ribose transport system substrate-binding protein